MMKVIDGETWLYSVVHRSQTIIEQKGHFDAHYHVRSIENEEDINLHCCAWPFRVIHA